MAAGVERFWLIAASLAYLACAARAFLALGANQPLRASLANLFMVAGFVLQTYALYLRGQAVGHCPLGNLYEVLIFIAWSLVLTYLVVGPPMHMSILGVFTAPFVFVLNFLALALPVDGPRIIMGKDPVLELHASLCIVGFGAFGVAAVAGLMYLIQERQLKQRKLTHWFYDLPAINQLENAHRRLLLWAYTVFTCGVVSGFFIERTGPADSVKIAWSVLIWLLYSVLLAAPRLVQLSQKKVALFSVAACLFVLMTFWGVNSYSLHHRFAQEKASVTEM
jgi:ABC-type uncharacterized transport system permease subunit